MISVEIVADSLNQCDNRLVTFKLVYPWYIHWDFLTHRDLSRNSASSRAIPIWKVRKMVRADPAMPIFWGVNGKGMQSVGELGWAKKLMAKAVWKSASYSALFCAWLLEKLGLHKQDTNKILTPFMHITTVVSATEWGNFFSLRAHKDAHPTFQELAFQMMAAWLKSEPRQLNTYDWHLPFADQYINGSLGDDCLLKIATARSARTSYLNFDEGLSFDKDYKLHDQLMTHGHWSPFEHCAYALPEATRAGNFVGFMQYRKFFPQEVRKMSREEMMERLRGYEDAK